MGGTGYFYVIEANLIGSRTGAGSMAMRAEPRLALLNQVYRDSLAGDLIFDRKGILTGLIRPDVHLPRLIRQLRFRLRPYLLRVGIGLGPVLLGLDRDSCRRMKGSGFFYAREAFSRIKKSHKPATFFAGEAAELMQTVNVFYDLIDAVQNRWSEKQWSAVHAYERHGTFELAGRELKLTPQNVNKHCREANWKAVLNAEAHLNYILRQLNPAPPN